MAIEKLQTTDVLGEKFKFISSFIHLAEEFAA